MTVYGKTGLALIAVGLGGSALLFVFGPADMRLEIALRMGMNLMLGVILVLVIRRFPMSAPPADAQRDPEELHLIIELTAAHNALEGAWNRQDNVTYGPLLLERDRALQALLAYYQRVKLIGHVELNLSKCLTPPVPRAVDEIPWDGLK